MPAVLTHQGREYLLRKIIGKEPQGDLILRLFRNNYHPRPGSAITTFKEVEGGGYAPRVMWGVLWDEKATHFENVETFEFEDKAGRVYGYYVTGRGQLIFAERFDDAPYEVQVKGDKIEVKIKMELIRR